MQVHMKRKKYVKRVLAALLIVILSFSVISMIATMIFFRTAFPRSDTLPEFSYSYAQMAEEGYPCQQIEFPSGANRLTGYYYAPDAPQALVVIASGFGDSGAAHLAEMKTFVDSGYGVLCYDATGVGESEGVGKVGLTQPAIDLRSALDCIAEDDRFSSLPILLYGHSAGGYAAATCVDAPRVKAAVIISAFDDPVQLMRESARDYVGILADIEYPFLWMGNRLTFGADEPSASACIEDASVPVAVFEGADDDHVPPSLRLSHTLNIIDNGSVTLTVCDEAPHSGHSGIWLSDAAISYRKTHDDAAAPDPAAANALDPEFMSMVLSHYQKAL